MSSCCDKIENDGYREEEGGTFCMARKNELPWMCHPSELQVFKRGAQRCELLGEIGHNLENFISFYFRECETQKAEIGSNRFFVKMFYMTNSINFKL